MNKAIYSILFLFTMLLFACVNSEHNTSLQAKIQNDDFAFEWKLDSLDIKNRISYITHTFTNLSKDTLQQDWTLYYNQIFGGPDISTLPNAIEVKKLSGTFFSLAPTQGFLPIPPNESYSYSYQMKVPIIRKSDVPVGIYIVKDSGSPQLLEKVSIQGLELEDLSMLSMESAASRYKENNVYGLQTLDKIDLLIPQPKRIIKKEGSLSISGVLSYEINASLENETNWLRHLIGELYNGPIQKKEDGIIQLVLDQANTEKEGAYSLTINDKNILIKSGNRNGILNGISSLGQLIGADSKDEIILPTVEINDSPDYDYRGIMIDVSRHFHSVGSIKSVMDMMAFYKLNKFHFHLGDDEGWRVEIKDLPELTEVGARRGHTLNELESGHLQPAYGSGPYPAPEDSYGSGWYSKSEYVELVRYAADRHIEIIPEFDMPGHARAAITAMKVRYNKYKEAGNMVEAEKYLLSDPDDISEYSSAQGYGDNSFCVCRESTFTFVEKVLEEVIAMHNEAGAPLKTFHSGGDEVAYGSWHKSPLCKAFIKANSESVSHTDDLQPYFTQRYMSIIAKYGLVTAGWEEFALVSSSEGHNGKELNPKFIGQNMQPYVWNATWGWGREDMTYKLANAGYKTVMCNSAQLYFDMAYNMDSEESGLMWTGMVDATNPFYLIPEDIYALPHKKNNMGVPVSDDLFTEHTRLTPEGKKNIIGIQGHLWSETVTNNSKIQYYLFPKSVSLSERAWNAYPQWETISDKDERWATMQKDWGQFANKIGQHHMPMMDELWDGINYRIPLPGMAFIDGKLHANVRYPGLTLRYTTDGTEVKNDSPIYTEPVPLPSDVKTIKMKAFATNGRSSRQSVLML